ncbi:hypothetical protein [Kitasatospora herbaricolor]|uniref:Asp23/Gls24 family envelope stress response protein n=1 Tax=Kitasatospora herbaricolor TaxID=68217 RepID=A0ABZ1WHT0_9ACTN|nr:hypothetical protein [Kitasatospora herbaricolor]
MAIDPPAAERREPRGTSEGAGHLDPDREQILACGRPLAQVWQHAHADGNPDPHTARCPYCRQALQSLAALEQAAGALRAIEPPSSHHVAGNIMRAVRAEMHLGRILPLDDPALELRITENSAAILLRRAADRVPGARAVSCRLTPAGGGTAIHASMTLAADPRRPLRPLAERVRTSVLEAADRQVGLRVVAVDIHIAELLRPADDRARPPQEGAPR